MKNIIASIVVALTVTGSFAATASAETKKVKKPTVCMNYAIAKTDRANDDAVGICYDTKKPSLFRRFEEKEIPGAESGRIKVLLGWK